jgi:hypothetical protein
MVTEIFTLFYLYVDFVPLPTEMHQTTDPSFLHSSHIHFCTILRPQTAISPFYPSPTPTSKPDCQGQPTPLVSPLQLSPQSSRENFGYLFYVGISTSPTRPSTANKTHKFSLSPSTPQPWRNPSNPQPQLPNRCPYAPGSPPASASSSHLPTFWLFSSSFTHLFVSSLFLCYLSGYTTQGNGFRLVMDNDDFSDDDNDSDHKTT